MEVTTLHICPATLAEGYDTYSPVGLKRMFDGRKVSHILPYDSPNASGDDVEKFMENRVRISISGVQEKMSFVLDNRTLRLTGKEEHGAYILKPVARDVKKVGEVPANEHLTMQIARQVFGINTAENALIFFKNGELAYLCKRFDVRADGSKLRMEDFASLAGLSKENAGPDFKYESSYEEIGLLMRRYVPAWRVEIEKYFTLVVFNFLFSNGDAHLKNFGLLETTDGDFILSPAYDLLNTRIHVSDVDFALKKSLFADGSRSILWQRTGHPAKTDFYRFGAAIGIAPNRIAKLLAPLLTRQEKVARLTANSFLSAPVKQAYLNYYDQKIKQLLRY
jgi:serine/threonine-protein kinase HipA